MLGLYLTEFGIVPNKYLYQAQSWKTGKEIPPHVEFEGSSRGPQHPAKSDVL
jgi:hypothetical protein